MISKDTIWSGSWSQFFSILDANVSDPAGRNAKWKYSAFPDLKGSDFPGFPIIIINPPAIARDTITLSSIPLKNYDIDIRVEIYDTSAKRVKSIADSVLKALEDARETFRENGMQNFAVGSSAYDILKIEEFGKVHYVSVPCSYTHKEA